jgi:hypothetical protein
MNAGIMYAFEPGFPAGKFGAGHLTGSLFI